MPDETTADATVDATPYTFPFEVPEDLATLTDDELAELGASVREHSQSLAGTPPGETTDDILTGLRACRDLAFAVRDLKTARRALAAEAAALAAEVDGADDDDPDDDDDGEAGEAVDGDAAAEGEPEAEPDDTDTGDGTGGDAGTTVTAGAGRRPAPPSVRQVARRSRASQIPLDARRGAYASMHAATGIAGFHAGQKLGKFADAAKALSQQIDRYPAMTASRAGSKNWPKGKRPITAYDESDPGRVLQLRDYNRHQVVELRRAFPDDQRVYEGSTNGFAVAEHVASERRLPGGGLIQSVARAVKEGRTLTAAAGWCAPSDVMYDLLELETLDGQLDVPELQTPRGGWQIPINGGPDFSVIYNAIGNAGNTHLTEAQVMADVEKVCTEILCPDFDDVRLAVDYYCLTGGLLQRRGYPEAVARFARGAAVALAHKINNGVITQIETGSGAINVIPQDLSGDDAGSALLAAVELAIVDMKYRNRMGFAATMEVILPWWVLVPIRAAMSRRRGVAMMAVSNAEILSWFGERGAVPRFVYDWQDAFAGLATGPGGATPLVRLPATADFLVYPAGTWVKAVQDVVSLDTIYDSTLLATNQYTAVFVEDGWAMLKMGPLSRRYRVNVDPSGVTGCCENVGS